MKIKPSIFSMIIALTFVSFLSCSEDDSGETDDDVAGGCANFEDDYTAIAEALSAFSENPSTETCEAYKTALLEFYDDYNDCPYWGDYYQEAYNEIQNMECSQVEPE